MPHLRFQVMQRVTTSCARKVRVVGAGVFRSIQSTRKHICTLFCQLLRSLFPASVLSGFRITVPIIMRVFIHVFGVFFRSPSRTVLASSFVVCVWRRAFITKDTKERLTRFMTDSELL